MTLEELLNKLIQMGWKPWGNKYPDDDFIVVDTCLSNGKTFVEYEAECYSLRDLVSMESGLWQFTMNKNLTNLGNDNWFVMDEVEKDSETVNYWLAKSSIHENIEQFLLDNILIPTK